MCNLREGFVSLREGFEEAPWRLREAFSKTRSAKASRSPLEGFAKASRRRHGRLHLETIRQIMTSPRFGTVKPCRLVHIIPIYRIENGSSAHCLWAVLSDENLFKYQGLIFDDAGHTPFI